MKNIDFTLQNSVIKNQLLKLHISDIAVVFEDHPDERVKMYEILGVKKFSTVFILLQDDIMVKFYLQLKDEQRKSLLKFLEIDDLKSFIELFRVSYHNEIFQYLPKTTQEKVKKLLAYDGDTAGAISSPHFLVYTADDSVKGATDFVIRESDEKAEIDTIFFKNEENKYLGAIRLSDLIVARGNQLLKNLIDENYPFVYEDDLISKAIKKIRDYDITILPVLSETDQMIGIITSDDALTIMEDDHIEAVESLVQLHDHNEDERPFKRSMKRLPWLLMSVALNLIIASFLSFFQGTLHQNVALVLFQPMILGMAGNIGTQSIAVTILGIHQQKIKPMRHFWKEVGIAAVNSVISGVIAVGIVYGFLWLVPTDFGRIDMIALVVGLSLMIAMFISALVGVILPFVLRKLGADEKAASGPIISSVNDLFALGIYFLIATILLMSMA